ncbi:hypothetical protein [Vibrio sp. TBV020]|uniref:hypothetical protein n=1 Tax=Vibrio sp. TBV020 TaxID=3137398 RepID=UPI0038CD403C
MKGVNLTNAIAALRARVRARHSGDSDTLAQAELSVKAQEPCSSQVQQALIGNTEGKTLSNVTATWVKQRLSAKESS